MRLKIGLALLALTFTLPLEAAGYRSLLRKSTRSKQWYSTQTFQANVIWKATYFSPEFRRAFAKKHAKKNFLGPLESAQYMAKQEEKQSRVDEFFVGLYARKDYRSLALGENSFWEVVLINEKGEAVEPESIEFVEITPYERIMFPYLDRWSQGYRVLFPKTELGSHFKLSLRSVLGESVLKWD